MTNQQSATLAPHASAGVSNQQSAIVFLKLGGSLITDKTRVEQARPRTIRRLAREIKAALADRSDLRLVLG
ncbi:MAG TPA: hypothetical protein VII92_01790, partial [Anaerolineae bacterium]